MNRRKFITGAVACAVAVPIVAPPLYVALFSDPVYLPAQGYIDELRITNGVGIFGANDFTIDFFWKPTRDAVWQEVHGRLTL